MLKVGQKHSQEWERQVHNCHRHKTLDLSFRLSICNLHAEETKQAIDLCSKYVPKSLITDKIIIQA